MVGVKKSNWLARIAIVLTLLFFYVPIVFLIVFSFNDSRSLTVWQGFSLRWYKAMLQDKELIEAVKNTVLIAGIATVVSTFIGTITAIGLSKSKRIIKDIILTVNDLPILNPEIVTAIGMMLFFSTFTISKGFITLLIAHITFCIPYVILSVLPKLRSLDPNIAEAALDLGATPWQTLKKVIVPEIWGGIIAGALIAFTMSFDDFVISYFSTGSGVKNISIMFYTMTKRINPTINALSTIMVVVITATLLVINLIPLLKNRGNKEKTVEGY